VGRGKEYLLLSTSALLWLEQGEEGWQEEECRVQEKVSSAPQIGHVEEEAELRRGKGLEWEQK